MELLPHFSPMTMKSWFCPVVLIMSHSYPCSFLAKWYSRFPWVIVINPFHFHIFLQITVSTEYKRYTWMRMQERKRDESYWPQNSLYVIPGCGSKVACISSIFVALKLTEKCYFVFFLQKGCWSLTKGCWSLANIFLL